MAGLIKVDNSAAVGSGIIASYSTLVGPRGGAIADTDTAATRIVSTIGAVLIANSNAAASSGAFYINASELAIAGKTTKLNLQATINTNATSVGTVTYTAGLYPVATVGGAADVSTITFGTVTSGSTVAFANPATSTSTTSTSGDFDCPDSGPFVMAVANSAQGATDSRVMMILCLRVRHV